MLFRSLAPAIRLAEQGFTVSPHLASLLAAEAGHLGKWPAGRAIFFRNQQALQAGDLLKQTDLAKSLRLIARDGAKAFYEGEIAQKIAAEMKAHDGLITLDDLRAYRAAERVPVRGEYRGYQVVSMPPPSSGGVHIVQMLNMLEHFPLREQEIGRAHV